MQAPGQIGSPHDREPTASILDERVCARSHDVRLARNTPAENRDVFGWIHSALSAGAGLSSRPAPCAPAAPGRGLVLLRRLAYSVGKYLSISYFVT